MNRSCIITGGAGNLARQLAAILADRYEPLVLTDILPQPIAAPPANALYKCLDIRDPSGLSWLIRQYQPSVIIHLASLLSGSSERQRREAWQINTSATLEILEQAMAVPDCRVIFASSVATYGGDLPGRVDDHFRQWPATFYGVTKLACERLGSYAREVHGLDFRCIRLPITISRYAPPGAISAIFSHAFIESVQKNGFIFPVDRKVKFTALYIKDVIRAFIDLMEAPKERISQSVYNLSGFSATMEELSNAIRRELPQVEHRFELDREVNQVLSRWPGEIDDTKARHDWNWNPAFNLRDTAADFLTALKDESDQA